MAEISPVPNENLDSGQHLVTRRRLIKQAGAAGIALTALYVAPSFSSFGPKKAYASITGVPPTPSTDCSVCDILGKPRILTITYTGLAGDGFNHQNSSSKPPTITTFVADITV
ncbi:MAG: twin-arginine translocation signal domain-containing protein, partial [Chloroflexi bacterium]|nr:twin-arginine translocation signal domain-containing protein [Chloroflexota bacterium]